MALRENQALPLLLFLSVPLSFSLPFTRPPPSLPVPIFSLCTYLLSPLFLNKHLHLIASLNKQTNKNPERYNAMLLIKHEASYIVNIFMEQLLFTLVV